MRRALLLAAPLAVIAAVYGVAQIPVGVTGWPLSIVAGGLAHQLGDGTNTATSLLFAGGRAYVGYSGNEALLQSGSSKGLYLKVNGTNATFNTGTTALYSDSNANITLSDTNYIATEGGAANAITGTLTNGTLVDGLCVQVQLAHTLQAGANTFALNGGAAVGIKSHYNTANNIATAYAVTGRINLCYSSTLPAWVDMAQ